MLDGSPACRGETLAKSALGEEDDRRTLILTLLRPDGVRPTEEITMVTENASHVRHGVGAVRPYVHAPVSLPEFLEKTLGAVELERHELSPDSFHVELQIGDSVVVVEAGELPEDVTPWVSFVYVYVEDVDATYARALENGAEPFEEPKDRPYGERQAGFVDAGGNTWWVARYTG